MLITKYVADDDCFRWWVSGLELSRHNVVVPIGLVLLSF